MPPEYYANDEKENIKDSKLRHKYFVCLYKDKPKESDEN
jgi:hypothetical protein